MYDNDRWIFIVGGSSLSVPALLAAKKDFKLKVICSDGDEHCPGSRIADIFIPVSIYDIDSHMSLLVKLSKEWPHFKDIAGCLTCGTDAAVTTYAITQAMSLPGIPLEVATIVQNKGLMRNHLHEKKLDEYMPRWEFVKISYENSQIFIRNFMNRIGDVVLKPIGQRASKGISIIRHQDEIARAISNALQYNDVALVEERLFGEEYSIDGILDNGKVLFWNAVERRFDYTSGIPMEIGHINPAPILQKKDFMEMLLKFWLTVSEAMSVSWGPFKIDTLIQDGKPYILETACRLSGGWDSALTVPLSSGRSNIHTLIALATQQDYTKYIQSTIDPPMFAACHALFPEPGKVIKLHGKLEQFNAEGMTHPLPYHRPKGPHVRISVKPGDVIESYTHCATRPGFVVVADENYEAAWERASFVARSLAEDIITETV